MDNWKSQPGPTEVLFTNEVVSRLFNRLRFAQNELANIVSCCHDIASLTPEREDYLQMSISGVVSSSHFLRSEVERFEKKLRDRLDELEISLVNDTSSCGSQSLP